MFTLRPKILSNEFKDKFKIKQVYYVQVNEHTVGVSLFFFFQIIITFCFIEVAVIMSL